uniref:Uncharacterized protein n=1 Tax=Arundo donax TaxID=35708 RepID=A0A0A8YRI1_ARUDO
MTREPDIRSLTVFFLFRIELREFSYQFDIFETRRTKVNLNVNLGDQWSYKP